MTEPPLEPAPTPPPRRSEAEIAKALRLRADPPRVTRLSRKALATGAGLLTLAVVATAALALRPAQPFAPPATAAEAPASGTPGEAIAGLPRDYVEAARPREPSAIGALAPVLAPPGPVPVLGPPLPGDLGRPILDAHARGVSLPGYPAPSPYPTEVPVAAPDPAAQRAAEDAHAAARAGLFVAGVGVDGASPAAVSAALPPELGLLAGLDEQALAALGLQGRAAPTASAVAAAVAPAAPTGPVLLRAGTVIPAALLTRLNSDAPGLVVAQVTAPVRDSLTGTHTVIPQGSRLIGTHEGRVASGQRRLPVRWTALQTPDGQTRTLSSGLATDPSGAAGLADQLDRHWGGVGLAAGIATLLNIGTELASDQETALERALATATQDTIGRTAEALIQREIDRAPTLIIRPGTRVALLLTEDMR